MELRSGKKISRCSSNDSSSPKRARVGDTTPAADLCPLLPTELLEMIFQSLDDKSLLRIRLVCHRWKEIVDRKQSLQYRFGVIFPQGLVMNRRYRPENIFPAMFACFEENKIIRIGLWWPSFGEGLTLIFLWDCELSLVTLLEMLRYTPNLYELSLRSSIRTFTGEPPTADFELHKFHSFHLGPTARVFEVYSKIFPRLTCFTSPEKMDAGHQRRVCQLICSVQATLKKLGIQFTPFVLQQMAGMGQLRLRDVSLSGGNNDTVMLSRIQPSIEKLSMFNLVLSNSQLCEIGRNLPNLKDLNTTVAQDEPRVASFLAHMVQLTRLQLRASGSPLLSLHGYKTPNLRMLDLSSFVLTENSLKSYLKECRKLRNLRLENCNVQAWPEIFSFELPSSLRHLSLRHINVMENRVDFPPRTYNFENVFIDHCNVSPEWLIQLVEVSPRIDFLCIEEASVDDGTVLEFCRRARRLRTLCLRRCTITDVSVEHIIEHCAELRRLRVVPKQTLSDVAYERLRRLKNVRVSHF